MRPVVLWRTLPAGLALLAAGCGLNTSSSPEPLREEAVPEQLGGDREEEVTTEETQVEDQEPFPMWLIDRQAGDTRQLVQEPIPVQVEPSKRLVLETLVAQPTDALSEREGLTSAIPSDTTINDVYEGEEEGEWVVDLSEEFYDGPEDGRGRYAIGQVVLTLSELPEVESVSFLRDGEEVTPRDGDGAEVLDGPVTPQDYVAIVSAPAE